MEALARSTPSVLSASLCVVLAICYVARPDACAAITIFPSWAWLVPGLFLAALSLRGRGDRMGRAVFAAWLIFLLSMAEEPWSLGRALLRPGAFTREARPPGEILRVISLNCAIGNRLAAEEVMRYRPDVVLLQESPGRSEVEELARRLFGDGGRGRPRRGCVARGARPGRPGGIASRPARILRAGPGYVDDGA